MKRKLRKKPRNRSGEITRIEKQKRGKKYNFYLNDAFAFSIYEETLVEFSIGLGKKLSEKDTKKICEFDAKTKARNYALSLLAIRPRSLNELGERLFKKFPYNIAKAILSDLQEKSLASDEEFCRFWVGIASRKLKSKWQIRYELYQKKAGSAETEKALGEIDEKQEIDKAERLVEKFKNRYKNLSKAEQNIKLKQMLARRGFDWEVIRSILN